MIQKISANFEESEMTKPKIALVTTGGTIGSKGKDSLDTFDYVAHGERYGPRELLDLFPEAASVADVTPVDFGRVSSSAIGLSLIHI